MHAEHHGSEVQHDAAHGGDHMRQYWRVIISLAVLTAVEFGVAIPLHGREGAILMLGILALLGLAAWKAALVGRCFMHLQYDPRLLSLIAITPVVLAGPLLAVGVFDGRHGPNF